MDNQDLFYLFRDLQTRLIDVESRICDKVDDLKNSVDNRIDPLEKKVESHEHNFRLAKSLISWGGFGAIIAASWETLLKIFK